MELGELIKYHRKVNHVTQGYLAKTVGVDVTYISKIENGRYETPPSRALLTRIADALYIDRLEMMSASHRLDCAALQNLAMEYKAVARLLSRLADGDITLAQIEQIDRILQE